MGIDINDYNDKDLLTALMEKYNVDNDDVQSIMYQKRKEELSLKYHIWQSERDKRWRVKVPDLQKPGKKKLIVKTYEDDLYNALHEYDKEAEKKKISDKITVEELYPIWLDWKSLHTEASTYITRLNSDWQTFYQDTDLAKICIKDLNKLYLEEWALKLIREHSMTRKKYTNIQTIIRQMLAYAVELGAIEYNPMEQVTINKKLFQVEKKKSDKTQVYSNEEKSKLIQLAWEDYHNKTKQYLLSPLALIFQLYTGVRIGEVCVVRYEDIAGDYIHIQRMLRRDTGEVVPHSKTPDSDRFIYLTSKAKKIIQTAQECQSAMHVDCGGYIFSIDGQPLTERCINDLLKKYCRKENMLYRPSHSLRKTYGSDLLNAGVSINTVRQQLGHTDERTTLQYYCYNTSTDDRTKQQIENALSVSQCNHEIK